MISENLEFNDVYLILEENILFNAVSSINESDAHYWWS